MATAKVAFNHFYCMIMLLSACIFLAIGCSANNEIVMSPGMVIKAVNDNGSITIEAGQGLDRTYKWDDRTIKVKMWERNQRWFGSLGLYNPGGGARVHTVVEEGQQHFYSEEDAIAWLAWQNDRFHYVYSSDGLVIGWYTTSMPDPSMVALCVEVWQFYISGKKPTKLPGARDDLLSVSYRAGASPRQMQPGKFDPSSPKFIGGRWYSGKAIDIMQERKISVDAVEECITQGKSFKEGEYTLYARMSKEVWAMLDKNGKVVLVGN
jgi:hypothetical protein